MFGIGKRNQDETSSVGVTTTDDAVAESARPGGKGRPTPSRREAEARNQRPLVGSPALKSNATKEERRAAKQEARARGNAERALMRQAMITGDERYLPARDKGPAKRWVRDYVDARYSIGEFFLVFAVIALSMSLVPSVQIQLIATTLVWVIMIAVAIDAFLLRRRVNAKTAERFGDKAVGTGTYAMMRSLQLRRLRMPRPQVKRGEFPA